MQNEPDLSTDLNELAERVWRFDAMPFDQRPGRQFVWVSGERHHSGVRWRRDHWGVAYIRPDGLGYRDEDIAQIEREGDMDAGTGEVYGWLPAKAPAFFDMERREAIDVNEPIAAALKSRAMQEDRNV